jgi:hypothetical protein
MSGRYSLVLAGLAALTTITSMVGQVETISAQNQNQTITAAAADLFLGVNVLFESPTVLILQGSTPNHLGQVIDIAIQNGYKVDSVTLFTEKEPGTSAIMLTPVHTVFMSK